MSTTPRPLPLYTLAYLAHRLEDASASAAWLTRASAAAASATHVFPSRPEMIPVLEHAIREAPGDVAAHEYLGNLLAGLGRLEDAERHWLRAADGASAVAHRNLALLAWRRDNDLAAAARWYRRALEVDSEDQTLHRDLAAVLIESDRPEEAVATLEHVLSRSARRADATIALADAYTRVGRFDDAIALLEATSFTNREGARDTWLIFSRAHVERGIARMERATDSGEPNNEELLRSALTDFETARTYPGNLGVGRPHEPLEARALYWSGRALDALGEREAAVRAWQACIAGPTEIPEQAEHARLCASLLDEARGAATNGAQSR